MVTEIFEGELDAEGLKIAVVVSRFNEKVTGQLLTGAKDKLFRLGLERDDLVVVRVPGSFELPRAVGRVEENFQGDGIVALGAVIRGETPHFNYVASETSKGLAQLNLELPVPVSFGLITADTMQQALDRSGGKQGNKGAEAAESLVEMILLEKNLARGS